MKRLILSLGLLVSSAKMVAGGQNLKLKIASLADSITEGVVVGLVAHRTVGNFFNSSYSLPLTCLGATGISLGAKAATNTLFSVGFTDTVKSTVKTLLAGGFTAGGAYLIGFRDPMNLAQIGAAGALAYRGVKSLERNVLMLKDALDKAE